MDVDIRGLHKATLALALWENSRNGDVHRLGPGPTLSLSQVQAAGEWCRWDFDYLEGRLMKCNLSGDSASSRLYDRDNGQGVFKGVVDTLRRFSG